VAVDYVISVNGAGSLSAGLSGASMAVEGAVDQILDYTSAMLLTQIKRNASGRPGPNAPTGDYRRSWTRRRIKNGWVVGTNRPQARRLEMGFYGRDSLGRMYHQQPYPHLGPAMDTVTPPYLQAMDALAKSISSLDGSITFGVR